MREGGIEGELAVSFLTVKVSRCCTHINMFKKREKGEGWGDMGLFKG